MGRRPLSRWLPGTGALGILARLAAWPLLFVGARALAPSHDTTVALVLTTILVALGLAKTRRAAIATGLVVLAPAFGAAHAAAIAMGLPAPAFVAALVAIGSGAALFRATVAHHAPVLDARALALAPVALWIGFAALQARFGAEAVHLHGFFSKATVPMAAVATALAIAAVAATTGLRAWLGRVADGTSPSHRVGSVPSDGPMPPRLSDVEPCDAAIVEVGGDGPYRTTGRAAIALVPASLEGLARRYARETAVAAMVVASSAATLFALASPLPRAAHATRSDDAPLPALPGACQARPPALVLVPTEGLAMIDVDAVAARYRKVMGIATRIAPPLHLDASSYDARRGQLVAEDVLTAARTVAARRPNELVLVLTDRDMFLRSETWRYAFAYRDGDAGAIISVARMASDFPWDAPSTHAPQRPACSQVLDDRMHKMITRQILVSRCWSEPRARPDHRSIMRGSIMSVADLDAVDERSF